LTDSKKSRVSQEVRVCGACAGEARQGS
jgi:hypothetical protein